MNCFVSNVLEMWYKENGRSLPWRMTKDPYAVWISEIILQQTRVVQGLDYYKRFMSRFPTVQSLAEAPLDEVLLYWQGLGYYSRARNLYTAAQQIVAHGGFPDSYHEVLDLKGVGEYTAAAICSVAFDLPYAVLDGNVYRVLSRIFGIDTPIDSTKGKKEFSSLAQELLDKEHPGLYNQAIMDFGALKCVPKSPDCLSCPFVEKCEAFANQKVDSLPVKAHKTKVTDRYFHYLLVCVGDELILHQRTGNDIWQGLFELPMMETLTDGENVPWLTPDVERSTVWHQFIHNGTLRMVHEHVKHVLSHRVIHASLYELRLDAWPESLPDGYFKLKFNSLDRYAVPRLIEILLQGI